MKPADPVLKELELQKSPTFPLDGSYQVEPELGTFGPVSEVPAVSKTAGKTVEENPIFFQKNKKMTINFNFKVSQLEQLT